MLVRPSYSSIEWCPRVLRIFVCTILVAHLATSGTAQEVADAPRANVNPDLEIESAPSETEEQERPPAPKLPPPAEAKRLDPKFDAWVDKKRGIVLVDGQVTLRAGQLEMFACPKGTKEHESIVACNTKAFLIHAALLHVGAKTGTPVLYDDEYHPPTGTEVEIELYWIDQNGKRQKARAQDWVRDVRTKKAMNLPWVFAGSGFWKDETTGEEFYKAESGDFICVSNFSSAMLDVPAESTQANDGLAFEAFTEHVPPLGTWVRLVLRPKLTDQTKTETDTVESE